MGYKTFFGFQKEPFCQDIRVEDLYPLPGLQAASERFLYALNLGAASIITGDVGSGKSTALRYATAKLHPSQYKVVSVVASTGSMADTLRQICNGFDVDGQTNSLARLTKTLRSAILEISQRKQIPVLIIDEASLMRLEIFAQLHTLSQFDMDSKPLLPIVLAGQNNLVDKLMFHTSRPLASRIMRVDSIIEGMLAGQNKGLWIMAGTAMCKTETGKDSRYAPYGRQRMDPHGFHFLEYGIGAVGAAPVITVEPYDCDDFFDFTLAEGSAVYRHC